ncbi:MAG TPA: adenosylcobinamide-GDP ribazoletransferase, partial [Gemmatimonadaceae bacterium]
GRLAAMTTPEATRVEASGGFGVAAEIRALVAATTFLTRIPGPRSLEYDATLLARSTAYFPLIGVVVGALGGVVFVLSAVAWTPFLAAVLCTAATIWLTGAFHEDGLADACDGFGGGWSREQVLAIMKDSRIGSYGAVGLGIVLLAKVGALATIAEPHAANAARALVAGHVLGRWSSLPLIRFLPYARDTEGKSRPFAASVTRLRLSVGSAIAFAGVWIALTPFGAPAILAVLVAATAGVVFARSYFQRRLGGMTGDCLGAANQLIEVTTYLLLATTWLRP